MKLPKPLTTISKLVRPLRDRVLVQKIEYKHPTLAVVGVELQKGVVVAIGYGRRKRKMVRFDKAADHLSTQGALWFEDGVELNKPPLPMKVKIGDCVEFSPRNQIEWDFNGEKLVWIWQNAIYGTTNDSQYDALLFQQSAGYDRHGNFLPQEGSPIA